MKNLLLTIALAASFCGNAQIRLNGYKCKYYKDQWPYTMAELYSKKDTFRYTLYSRDIYVSDDEPDPDKKELELGLELCFDKHHYHKTKDSLYISTRMMSDSVYIYEVYIPNHMVSLSVRSRSNDSSFSEKSKWLVAQIRQHSKGDIFFLNEKNKSCQDPNNR